MQENHLKKKNTFPRKTNFLFRTALFLLFVPSLIFPKGTKESDYQTVEGLENWRHTFDLSLQEPGVYNILIEGKDKAGNLSYAGPINISIDPESDLPRVSVSNPSRNMRIGGDLFVVGTCVDDDGVEAVEVRLGDGEWQKAQGKEFWSIPLSMEGIGDGALILQARGIDINGVTGKPVSVPFHLDRVKPVNSIINLEQGALVQGIITLQGKVFDANGIRELFISRDGGSLYEKKNFRFDKKTGEYYFSERIDTRKLPDGPNVLWMKSLDLLGSTGYAAFLFFVDNTPPQISIYHPDLSLPVHGNIRITGQIDDLVGVKSLKILLEKQEIPVAVRPGDPFWSAEVSLLEVKKAKTALLFAAEDIAGNTSQIRYTLRLDREADLPKVSISYPLDKSVIHEGIVQGFAEDDDGIKGIIYSLNREEESFLPSEGAFVFGLDSLSPGKHSLSIRGVDIHGTEGKTQTISFTYAAEAPEIQITEIAEGEDGLPFRPGFLMDREKTYTLKGSVISPNPLSLLEFSLGDTPAKKVSFKKGDTPENFIFSIPIKTAPYGIVFFTLKATDNQGKIQQKDSFVRVINRTTLQEEYGVTFIDNRIGTDGTVSLKGNPLSGYFHGWPISQVELSPPLSMINPSFQGNRIILEPTGEGEAEPSKVIVTTDRGHRFESGEYRFTNYITPPEIIISSPEPHSWVRETLEINLILSTKSRIAELTYSINSGLPKQIIDFPAEGGEVLLSIPTQFLEDKPHLLTLKAADPEGNSSVIHYPFRKDTRPPEITLVLPEREFPREGGYLSGLVSDSGSQPLLTYSWGEGETEIPLSAGLFSLLLNSPGPEDITLTLKARDSAGNETALEIPVEPVKIAFSETHPSAVPAEETAESAVQETATQEAGSTSTMEMSSDSPPETEAAAEAAVEPETDSVAAESETAPLTEPLVVPSETATIVIPALSLLPPSAVLLGPAVSQASSRKLLFALQLTNIENITSISYTLGNSLSGSIPVTGKTVYYSEVLDVSSIKPGTLPVVLQLVPLEGKAITLKPGSLLLDDSPYKPVTEVFSPVPGTIFTGEAEILASAQGLRPIASLVYSLNRGAEEILETPGSAVLSFREPARGKNTLILKALDTEGVAGTPVTVEFLVADEGPKVNLTSIGSPETPQDFHPGILTSFQGKDLIQGEVLTYNTLAEGRYRFDEGPWQSLRFRNSDTPGKRLFSIPAGRENPYGRNILDLEIKDSLGNSSSLTTFFYRIDTAYNDPILDKEGLYFRDLRLSSANAVLISQTEPLKGLFLGREIRNVTLNPPQEHISVTWEGDLVILSPLQEGIGSPAQVVVETQDGDFYRSEAYRFDTDLTPPEISVEVPERDLWIKDTIPLTLLVSDTVGVGPLEYSLDNGTFWQEFPPGFFGSEEQKEKQTLSARGILEISDLPDGPFTLILRASDLGGNISLAEIPLNKDTVAPVITLVSPGREDLVNGLISLIGFAEDSGPLVKVEWSDSGEEFELLSEGNNFSRDLDISSYNPLPDKFYLRAEDKSGNIGTLSFSLNVDNLADLPIVEIHIPSEEEVIRGDFTISGIALDDDGIAGIFYRLDEGEFLTLPGDTSFRIPVALDSISDNDHTLEVKAVDIYGVESEIVSRTFWVSKKEPVSTLVSPDLTETVKEIVILSGEAFDENGIREVSVSLDNGITFNKTRGREKWSYRADSRILGDGVNSVIIKAVDNLGTEGVSASIITIDNTPPSITLDRPGDGEIFTLSVPLEGRISDDLSLSSINLEIIKLSETKEEESTLRVMELPITSLLLETLDSSDLTPGWYNLRFTALDKAGNSTTLSRNIILEEEHSLAELEILFPLEGETRHHRFNLVGRFVSSLETKAVTLYGNGETWQTVPVNESGYFVFEVENPEIEEGPLSLQVATEAPVLGRVESEVREIIYKRYGPWISIKSHNTGDYITGRPYLEGSAGYFTEDQEIAGTTRKKEQLRITKVELSLDNGRNFLPVKGTEDWKFRMETQDYPEGDLQVLLRGYFSDSSIATEKAILQLDKTPPSLAILKPEENGRFNEVLEVLGTAQDSEGLDYLRANIRKGDKAGYQVPSFIQGLYLDTHFLGATYFDVGLGLTFFDDNVKLQALFGTAPPGRFSGLVLGAKLLANIAYLPFSYLFGPDWDFLSLSLAVGANFSYFTMTDDSFAFTDEGLILGSVIGQLEFPRVEIKKWQFFSTYSFYTEFQLWFISSDVEGGFLPKLSFGARIGLF